MALERGITPDSIEAGFSEQLNQESEAAEPQPEASLRSNISQIEHHTDIDSRYGKDTWRPSQSVVDILQNHLDASTISRSDPHLDKFYQHLAEQLGPQAAIQVQQELQGENDLSSQHASQLRERLTESLKHIHSESNLVHKKAAYTAMLFRLDSLSVEQIEELLDKSEHLEHLSQELWQTPDYQPPHIRLKLSDGTQAKFVDYQQVRSESPDWQVMGYLISDQGPGFDSRLMGLMGASTKRDDRNKRGGLGEGLKMSVAQLNRVGADVRIVSQNTEQSWWLKPREQDGLLTFEGKEVPRPNAEVAQVTGSRTYVDLSSADLPSEEWQLIRTMLDPRLTTEGIGKYALEYNPDLSPELLEEGGCLDVDGMPPGRVYVKGLLVEEDRRDLLWSYNLAEKWAISGRDRKTIHHEMLDKQIQAFVEQIDDLGSAEKILSTIKHRAITSPREADALMHVYHLGEHQREVWRQAFQNIFDYQPGVSLFYREFDTSANIRLAQQRGYELILVNNQAWPSLARILEILYPGRPKFLYEAAVSMEHDQSPGQEVSPSRAEELYESIDRLQQAELFVTMGTKFRPTFLEVESGPEQEYQMVYDYLFQPGPQYSRKIFTTDKAPTSLFAQEADLLLAIKQIEVNDRAFEDPLQLRLKSMVVDKINAQHPELAAISLPVEVAGRQAIQTAEVGYSQEKQQEDQFTLSLCELLSMSNSPDASQNLGQLYGQLERAKEAFRQAPDALLVSYAFAEVPPGIFMVDGQPMTLSQRLEVVPAASEQEDLIILEPGQGEVNLQESLSMEQRSYLVPFELERGQQKFFALTTEQEECQFAVVRGEHGLALSQPTGTMHRTSDTSQDQELFVIGTRGQGLLSVNISLRGSGLQITGKGIRSIQEVESPQSITESQMLPERNQGKHRILSNTAIEYGSQVWSDPRRLLIDAVQNHVDANLGQPPTIDYKVANLQGQIRHVAGQELVDLDQSWVIIGLAIQDQGHGYTTPYLTQLGTSNKADQSAGKFGEGLKMLSASATLQGLHMELQSRDWTAKPVTATQEVYDYESQAEKSFDMLAYEMEWHNQNRAGSQTTFALYGDENLSTDNLAELVALSGLQGGEFLNAYGPQVAAWGRWLQVIDPRRDNPSNPSGVEAFILEERSEYVGNRQVEILLDKPGQIYEKNLLIPDGDSRLAWSDQLLFGYNLQASAINTRERNAVDPEVLEDAIRNYFARDLTPEVAVQLMRTAQDRPGDDYTEYRLLKNYSARERQHAILRQAYYEVFGQDAILTLGNINDEMRHLEQGDLETSVERGNAVRLPHSLTQALHDKVYTTQNVIQDMHGAEVEVSSAERQQLFEYTSRVNSIIIDYMERLLEDPDKAEYLQKAYKYFLASSGDVYEDKETLRECIEGVKSMEASDLRVGAKENPRGGAYLGFTYSPDGAIDARPRIELSQSLLTNRDDLLGTYIHELIHHLSQKRDYSLNFQRYFVALAMQAAEEALGVTQPTSPNQTSQDSQPPY